MSITETVKARARQLGFDLAGVCLPERPSGLDRFQAWLDSGFGGEMTYLQHGANARSSPASVLPGVKSIIMLGISYHQPEARVQSTAALYGREATYAPGQDYHEVLWGKLNELTAWLNGQVPGSQSRGVVDTAPFLERDYARLAGLGWFGKNTMLINKKQGSFFFLAALLTTAELDPDQPHLASHCGTCTACLDACPTRAFPEPGVLDATKCISYLTIELRKPIPSELRSSVGDWVFGCDICQDVCPWNRKAPTGDMRGAEVHRINQSLDLIELLGLPTDEFRQRFRHTALWRTKRRGLLRNACIVLGNQRDPRAIPALSLALQDVEPLVRGAAAWAIGEFQLVEMRGVLQQRLGVETDETVREEISSSLRRNGIDQQILGAQKERGDKKY